MESATLTRSSRPGPAQPARLAPVRSWPWERIALAVLVAGALIGFFAFPTYPTYDSFYALLWGRDLLQGHLPDFQVYRGPTEHPLAIAFGMFCSLFGEAAPRLVVLGAIFSFVALVVGIYQLGKHCFGPFVGVLAGLLLLSRFYDENLAAQGYLDLTYVALVVWATALEVARPRRGTPVFLMLAAAGLLRPDAWVLSGAYWLWCAWPRPGVTNRRRLWYLALTVLAPLLWVALDWGVTGDPLYSLHATSGLAEELERTQGFSSVVGSVWTLLDRIDHGPVLVGAIAGALIALLLTPRRAWLALTVLVLQLGVFVLEGAAGASVVSRYMMGAAAVAVLFCAVAVGGWSMLRRGSKLRLAWMVAALGLVAVGANEVATSLSLASLRNTLAYHEDFHTGLAAALHSPSVEAQLRRCPLVSLPDNKLIPDARWILDRPGQQEIVARSEARADALHGAPQLEDRIKAGSIAIYALGPAVFFEAIVDVGDDARDQVPLTGFKRIYVSQYYAVYANC